MRENQTPNGQGVATSVSIIGLNRHTLKRHCFLEALTAILLKNAGIKNVTPCLVL